MGLLDIFKKVENKVVNPTDTPKRSKLGTLNVEQSYRVKQDLDKWRLALTEWERVDYPDRYSMIRLYNEIAIDGQISTKVQHIIRSIMAQEWTYIDSEGEQIEVENLGFQSEWFKRIVTFFVGAEMQGYSLMEVLKQGQAYSVELFPRDYVQPDKGFVRKNRHDNSGMDMYSNAFQNQCLYAGDPDNKGLFNVVAPLYIYKKNALQFWSNYQNKYGVPAVIAHTDVTDEKQISDVQKFLKGLESNQYAVLDEDTTVDILATSSTDGYLTFRNMLEYVDGQISKILEGQTMTSDDGSSQSQANVHANVAKLALRARLTDFMSFFNAQMVPFMVRDGFLPEGAKINYIEVEDTEQNIDNIVKLNSANYFVDPEQVEQLTGYRVTVSSDFTQTIDKLDEKFDVGGMD